MTHDKYEHDILKQLTRIATSLEKIERKLPDGFPAKEVKVDTTKSLYAQGLPCCANCKELIGTEDKHCMYENSIPYGDEYDTICTNYVGKI